MILYYLCRECWNELSNKPGSPKYFKIFPYGMHVNQKCDYCSNPAIASFIEFEEGDDHFSLIRNPVHRPKTDQSPG